MRTLRDWAEVEFPSSTLPWLFPQLCYRNAVARHVPFLRWLGTLISGVLLYFRQCVRIDDCSSLETWAWELESNPEPKSLWAAWPVDHRTACLRFSEIKPPQADTKHIDPCGRKSQTKEIIAPNRGLITAPNGGTDLATISFMNLKSTPATNQEQTQERGMGPSLVP
ncbi:hypothetical protein DSO57_1018122 [Entomophthora muscae]|uniref:Uncharacterized protein n=1 Tax=Entomophthora muscae TaxID=34485 RepID=A0ACC2T584_9FUNG|nr:hypothetical protein DSO57_1018122 [Entomophthora muscae]